MRLAHHFSLAAPTNTSCQEYQYYQTGDHRTLQEMSQKPAAQEPFFSFRSDNFRHGSRRPASVATEFVDTDWEEDEEIISDDENDNSPRLSVQSSGSGQPSFTTVSSYDEVPTPRSSRSANDYVDYSPKQVEGPRGPHLFRSSTDTQIFEDEFVLSLSPVTPKVTRALDSFLPQTQAPPMPPVPRRNSPFQYTHDELNTSKLVDWTPEMVAQSMLNAGIELSVADRFVENDINGPILITLKFEDLKELAIQSFGIRTKVWHQIQALTDTRPASPQPDTPIEDVPSKVARRETRKKEDHGLRSRQSTKRRHRNKLGDEVTPMESVSIIGIEQVIPKPHHCSKGENCSKFKKQQALIRAFQKEHPDVDMTQIGTIMIGDAGNPETARALDPNETLRPVSDAVPSVVASSDVLGPGGMPPLQYLQEATLRNLQSRDPQDNVRQFLNFQHHDDCNEVPPTPPFDPNPTSQAPHHGLRRLPKLAIPGKPVPVRPTPARSASVPLQQQVQQMQHQEPVQHQEEQHGFTPYHMDKADPLSPELETARNPYRFGTPFSEMDVPVTAVPLGPVSRDVSQSVPPDMNYRTSPIRSNPQPARTQSRASARRPSFPVLPALTENKPTLVHRPGPQTSPKEKSPRNSGQSARSQQQPLQAPPRINYPWSPVERKVDFEKAIPSMPQVKPTADPKTDPAVAAANGITHQGPMKKRKTRMLRHEWQDGYFTLKGSRLNMHKDDTDMDRTLEYVDIDDYAIACSSMASTSKLTAAFKAVHFTHNREKSDPVGAFSFQLIPQDKNVARLRKRESAIQNAHAVSGEGVNGTGKTHHFAVKSRDDRIDWMRELMLAKALKQKGEGFEISVNGNMI
ncbi:SAM and PH domain-containing protein [Thelonectria olida]|uniref:SAM and PH domain-containing protein n=1 Tax=Thelonectria olida TaxID=1576542 RepID=A0A9P8WF58_9HYPO|nr:SAM and PH domain-containing protein [Thelonectria olida]